MQNFSQETLETIALALRLNIRMLQDQGLETYADGQKEALDIVDEYLEAKA